MNTTVPVCERHQFLDALAQLSKEFGTVKVDIKNREQALERALNELLDSVKNTAPASRLTDDNPLTEGLKNTGDKVAASLDAWRNKVEGYQRNTSFREKFGDSLLVYVYGKVKAGKSSIGNYVAYGHGDPHPPIIDSTEPSPEFFFEAATSPTESRAASDELNKERKFAVGACETTASIQGFKLPGLTWIDSPGLHSKTEKNGALAEQYVESADLVLYPMSSSQPGRHTDMEEIAKLLEQGKRVEVVITRCDDNEDDQNDDGEIVSKLFMKSDDDRKDQSQYVYNQVIQLEQKKRDDNLEVLTVSVRYAEEHDGDFAQIEHSGMNALFLKLTKLTQSEGVQLKKDTPLNNLRAFVKYVCSSVDDDLCDELESLNKTVAAQRDELKSRQDETIRRALPELNSAIGKEVQRQQQQPNRQALERACTEHLKRIVTEHIEKQLSEILKETQAAVNKAVRFDELKGLPEFRNITKDVEISNAGKGRATGGLLGALVGGVIGLAIPVIGTVIGSAIGGALGGVAGGNLVDSTYFTVNLGDNTQEVLENTIRIAKGNAETAIKAAFAAIDKDFLKPTEEYTRTVNMALDQFVNTLKNEVEPQ